MVRRRVHKTKPGEGFRSRDVVLLLILAGLIAIAAFLVVNRTNILRRPQTPYEARISNEKVDDKCIQNYEFSVQDSNLEPMIKKKKVKLFINYYKCNPVLRNDPVVYTSGLGDQTEVVRAIPYDTIRLDERADGSRIYINDRLLKNSEGKEYIIKKPSLLKLYIKDYKGSLPENTYVLLPDNPNLITTMGFVDSKDFVGKITEQL